MMFILLCGLTLAEDGSRREVEAAEEAEGREVESMEAAGRWGQQDCSSGGCWGGLGGHHSPSTPLFALAERSNVLQRALNTLRFLWLLCQALVDGLTKWLDTCTQEHTDMSRVLRLERFVMAQRLAKVSPGHTGAWGAAPHGGTDVLPATGRADQRGVPG